MKLSYKSVIASRLLLFFSSAAKPSFACRTYGAKTSDTPYLIQSNGGYIRAEQLPYEMYIEYKYPETHDCGLEKPLFDKV